MIFEEAPLPGIGMRREFTVAGGRRVGVIIHRDGLTELIISRQDDPDTTLASIRLSVEEAAALGGLLGGAQLVAQLTEEHREMPGVSTQQVLIDPDSPFRGQTLGDTRMRTRTGSSVVAVLRDGTVIPSPQPEFEIRPGDLLVIVGTRAGLAAAAEILHPS